jgi:hypothetical protein
MSSAKLLFHDEFNWAKVNTKTWYRCFVWTNDNVGCSYGKPLEKEWYQTANITVGGGYLNIPPSSTA